MLREGNRKGRLWRLAALAAVLFAAVHVPFLPPAPVDLDSVNFVLAVDDYDVLKHQPHPPGYPVFVGLTKASAAALRQLATPADGDAVRAVAIWGALLGGLAAFSLIRFFHALEGDTHLAVAATLLTLVSPLYWFTANRPLTDVPGLSLALLAQALFVSAPWRTPDHPIPAAESREPSAEKTRHPAPGTPHLAPHTRHPAPRAPHLASRDALPIVLGVFVASLAIGVRTQTALLTLPLLGFVLFDRCRRRERVGALAVIVVASATVAILLWLVPLVLLHGGFAVYAGALGAEIQEDLTGVDMLATNPSPRGLVRAVVNTFVLPWAEIPLASLVLSLAAIGLVAVLRRRRRALAVLFASAVPYAIFHLLFHETSTTRYALPLIPAIIYVALCGLRLLTPRAFPFLATSLGGVFLIVVMPAYAAYGRNESPTFEALREVRARLAARPSGERPVLAMHLPFALALRGEEMPARTLGAPPKHEWLELVKYWRDGGRGPVWFFADPKRTDLALVDPESRRLVRSYRWPFSNQAMLGGARPMDVDWYEIRRPGWFLGEGWALTPETAGVAAEDGRDLGGGPIVAYLCRRERLVGSRLLIGGRHLGRPGDKEIRLEMSLSERVLDRWMAAPGAFLRILELPAGLLQGETCDSLSVSSPSPAPAGQRLNVAIEQFNLQPVDAVLYGFGAGWHEAEYDPRSGRSWRWASDAAQVRVHHGGHDLELHISGESPLRYFDDPPRVMVKAGERELAAFQPDADFDWRVSVPSAAVDDAGGVVTLATDRVFVPAEESASPDRRRLGLRIYSLTLEPADRPRR